jgi:hypothetical protein
MDARKCQVVDGVWRFGDRAGAVLARCAVGRMRYAVAPGLYAIGRPTPQSPVFVSANYKLSFDHLRRALAGRDGWILVLDTKGVNVWCAAGKGTFGTEEVVARVEAVQLADTVSHRTLVLPQLGAPGVSAHEVRAKCGFRVVYGPVRAADLPAFLDAGMQATPAMRRVRFGLLDRLVLVPVELVLGARYALLAALGLFLLGGLGRGGWSAARMLSDGVRSAVLLLIAFLTAVVLTPALLPWLPGRAFASKGAWVGLALDAALLLFVRGHPGYFGGPLGTAGWLLLIPALASFLGMSFTGASTYTSLSGVRREMRAAVPLQAAFALLGIALWLVGRFA